MKQIIKKILLWIVPYKGRLIYNNLLKISKLDPIEEVTNTTISKMNSIEQVLSKMNSIEQDILRNKINIEIIFRYVVGFRGTIEERQIDYTYERVQKDHILRYQFFADIICPGDVVLDCACGCGYGSAYLNDHTEAGSIIGGDIDPHVVEFCKIMFGSSKYVWKKNAVSFQQIDIANTEAFEKNFFDKICSFETIEHVPPFVAEKAFSNLYDWLKPGGVLYCSVPDEEIFPLVPFYYSSYHFRHYTPKEFEEALRKAGFTKIKLEYYNLDGDRFDERPLDGVGTILAICEK